MVVDSKQRRPTVYGFDVKDRGKDGQQAVVAKAKTATSASNGSQDMWDGGWQQRREKAAQFLASVDASIAARRRRKSSGIMW